MTSIEALELSIELWNWLVDNPTKQKCHHPTLPIHKWPAECALCKYAKNLCNSCLMDEYWPISGGHAKNCYEVGAYMDWDNSTWNTYDRSFFALILVEAFQKRLEELS